MEAETPDSFKERVDSAVAVIYGSRGFLDETGLPDPSKLAAELYPLVSAAVVSKTAERADKAVTRRALVECAFPDVPGPEAWAEQDDSELARHVYKRLDAAVWRLTSIDPTGQLQSRLNSDRGLVLCRTKVNPHRTDAAYVTRDRGCIVEDIIKPAHAAEKKRADKDAAVTVMLITRIPELAKAWDKALRAGLKAALDHAAAITEGPLALALEDEDEE